MITEKPMNPVEHNVIESVAKRWSPRAYSSKRVEAKTLQSLFEAARWSASSYNEQPWRFIIASKDNADAYNQLLSVANDWNQSWANLAPVLILTVTKKTFSSNGKTNRHALYDLGAAVAQLSLEAASRDLFVHQMAGIDPEKARALYAIPDDYEAVTLLTLGYLGEVSALPEEFHKGETRKRERKPVSDLVFEDTFGKSAALSK